MKKILSLAVLAATLFSCQKQEAPAVNEPISQDVLAAIGKAGFSTEGVIREEGGYIVEGDIFIDDNHLRTQPQWGTLSVPNAEQYRTTNLVTGLPRTIVISVDSRLPVSYVTAADEMIRRYNAENLQLTFVRRSSGADITLVNGNGSYLASAGFPTAGGAPHNQVKINARAIGSGSTTDSKFINYVATIMAHEIGHCIGFRHTDYMDRSYSCGGATANEGASTVGAIHIPGTPTTADPGSFMLACIRSGDNRPFNNNDKTALSYLY